MVMEDGIHGDGDGDHGDGRVTVVMEEGSHSNGEGWGLPW